MLTTTNAAGTNGLTYLPKHGGAWDNKLLVTHPMTDLFKWRLASAIARWAHWPLDHRPPLDLNKIINLLFFVRIAKGLKNLETIALGDDRLLWNSEFKFAYGNLGKTFKIFLSCSSGNVILWIKFVQSKNWCCQCFCCFSVRSLLSLFYWTWVR
jgi:hypothetical protein